jgi:hypothetical protein
MVAIQDIYCLVAVGCYIYQSDKVKQKGPNKIQSIPAESIIV